MRLKKNVERNYDTTSHITPTWRKKENKGWNKNKLKKDLKERKTTTRNKGKDTGKRTSTGNRTTYSGGETNEDCHERKNYHRMP